MREVEFRAQINKLGKLKHLNKWQYFTLEDLASNPSLWELINHNTLGEFTNSLDKEGVYIWEGDIVKKYGGTFQVVWNKNRWSLEPISGYQRRFILSEPSTLEVIGNIYENPKLLSQLANSEMEK